MQATRVIVGAWKTVGATAYVSVVPRATRGTAASADFSTRSIPEGNATIRPQMSTSEKLKMRRPFVRACSMAVAGASVAMLWPNISIHRSRKASPNTAITIDKGGRACWLRWLVVEGTSCVCVMPGTSLIHRGVRARVAWCFFSPTYVEPLNKIGSGACERVPLCVMDSTAPSLGASSLNHPRHSSSLPEYTCLNRMRLFVAVLWLPSTSSRCGLDDVDAPVFAIAPRLGRGKRPISSKGAFWLTWLFGEGCRFFRLGPEPLVGSGAWENPNVTGSLAKRRSEDEVPDSADSLRRMGAELCSNLCSRTRAPELSAATIGNGECARRMSFSVVPANAYGNCTPPLTR